MRVAGFALHDSAEGLAKIEEVTVYLSRRNLCSLLAKLDGHPSGSVATLTRLCENDIELTVIAEEDDVHYGERQPGPMHAETEALL